MTTIQPRTIVILIHGTWPRKQRQKEGPRRAAWCEESSPCCNAVRKALGEQVDIRAFDWQGANSPGARLTAADRLNEYLEGLSQENPHARIYLVAHSHAGNVVLYAAQHGKALHRICGAVFLSTPFLHISPRILGSGLAQKLELTASLGALVLVSLACALIWPRSAWKVYLFFHSASLQAFFLAFMPLCLAVGLLTPLVFVPALRALHRWNHAYAQRLRLPDELPFPVLIIRAAGDEAASALAATHLVSHLASRVLRASFRLVPADIPRDPITAARRRSRWHELRGFIRAGALICGGGLVLLGGLLLARMAGVHLQSELAHLLGGMTLFLFTAGALILSWEAVALLLIMPLFLILSITTALFALPFGVRFGLATFGLEVSAEPTPPGGWSSFQLQASNTPYESQSGLSHGTHSNPVALAEMTRWLRALHEDGERRRC
jgi:predicted alpha/beta hydrolase family esterase